MAKDNFRIRQGNIGINLMPTVNKVIGGLLLIGHDRPNVPWDTRANFDPLIIDDLQVALQEAQRWLDTECEQFGSHCGDLAGYRLRPPEGQTEPHGSDEMKQARKEIMDDHLPTKMPTEDEIRARKTDRAEGGENLAAEDDLPTTPLAAILGSLDAVLDMSVPSDRPEYFNSTLSHIKKIVDRLKVELSETGDTGHAMTEYECAMTWLDDRKIPMEDEHGNRFSLIGRVQTFSDSMAKKCEGSSPTLADGTVKDAQYVGELLETLTKALGKARDKSEHAGSVYGNVLYRLRRQAAPTGMYPNPSDYEAAHVFLDQKGIPRTKDMPEGLSPKTLGLDERVRELAGRLQQSITGWGTHDKTDAEYKEAMDRLDDLGVQKHLSDGANPTLAERIEMAVQKTMTETLFQANKDAEAKDAEAREDKEKDDVFADYRDAHDYLDACGIPKTPYRTPDEINNAPLDEPDPEPLTLVKRIAKAMVRAQDAEVAMGPKGVVTWEGFLKVFEKYPHLAYAGTLLQGSARERIALACDICGVIEFFRTRPGRETDGLTPAEALDWIMDHRHTG